MACLLALGLVPVPAGATVTVDSFTTSTSEIQAGAHPDLSFSFALGESGGPEAVKAVDLRLPAGYFLSPTAVPRCAAEDFVSFECPSNSQIGLITIRADDEGDPLLLGTTPVYALVPGTAEPARLGFIVPAAELPIAIPVRLRTSTDYGPNLTFGNFPQLGPSLAGAKLDLWGVPTDPGHDAERFAAGSSDQPAGCPGAEDAGCIVTPTPSSATPLPLLQSPTACGVALSATLRVSTYQNPDSIVQKAGAMAMVAGCQILRFEPDLEVGLTTAETNSSSGLDFGVGLAQSQNPNGLASAALRGIVLTLPPELTIDSEAADRLGVCSEVQFGLGQETPDTCPADSKVGAFAMEAIGFEDPLEGTAYFGSPEPDGKYRLLLAASGSGLNAKFVALVASDPQGEQVTVTISDLPQIPLTEIDLELASDSELLVTPARCGSYPATATFTPWSSTTGFVAMQSLVLSSVGPDEGPCPGPATDVEVLLSPASILADGIEASIATATVTDADEIPVVGDDIAFSSTDPDQQIDAVTDNGDGTYTAEVTSSTTAGESTIAATDTSTDPDVLGAATLTQLEPFKSQPIPAGTPFAISPSPPTPGANPSPKATITKKPASRTRDRTPTFRFTSSSSGSTFKCKVDTRPFQRCSSPTTLPRLGLGVHTFSVRATDGGGNSSQPAGWRFRVLAAEK
jgi:Invasin, domain 3